MWNSDPVDSFMRNLLRGDSSAASGNQHYQAADSMINMFGTAAGGGQPSPLSTSRVLAGGGGYGRQPQYQQPQQTHHHHQQHYHHQQQEQHSHHHQQQHAAQRPASPDPDYYVKNILIDDGMYRTARDVVNATMTSPAASRNAGNEGGPAKRAASVPNPLPTTKPKAKRTYKKKSLPKSKAAPTNSGAAATTAAPVAIAPAAASTNAAANGTESKKKNESSSKNGDGKGDEDGKIPPISDHFLEIVKFQMDIWGKNQPQLFQSICTLINTTFPFMAPLRFKTIHYVIGQVREKNPWLSQSLMLYYFPPSPATAPDTDNDNLVEGSYPGDEEKKQAADPSKDGTDANNQQPPKRKRGRPRKNAPVANNDGAKTPPASKTKPSVKPDTPKTRAQQAFAAAADGSAPAPNRTPNKLILQERATDKLKSGEIIPDGWLKRTFQRTSGNSAGTFDTYWISPITQKKLRSLNEVSRFLLYLKESPTNDENGEKYAWKKLRESSSRGAKKTPTKEGEGNKSAKKSAKGAASSGGGIAAAAAAAAAVVAAAYGGAGIPKQKDGDNLPGEMII